MEEVETRTGMMDTVMGIISVFFLLLFVVLAITGIIFFSILFLNATFA